MINESHPWHPNNLETIEGPDEIAIYDGQNDHLTTLPRDLWETMECEYGNPKQALVETIKEDLKRGSE